MLFREVCERKSTQSLSEQEPKVKMVVPDRTYIRTGYFLKGSRSNSRASVFRVYMAQVIWLGLQPFNL